MSDPADNNGSAAAAVALAEASAAAGTASARIGYELTTQALKESGAAVVFPLLALELVAIGEGFAAYVATDAAALVADAAAQAAADAGAAHWSSVP